MPSPWTRFDAHSTGPTFNPAKQALSTNPWWSSGPEGTVGVSVGVTTEIRGSRCYRAAGENCRVYGGLLGYRTWNQNPRSPEKSKP